jgi:hypothetical protein
MRTLSVYGHAGDRVKTPKPETKREEREREKREGEVPKGRRSSKKSLSPAWLHALGSEAQSGGAHYLVCSAGGEVRSSSWKRAYARDGPKGG